MTERASLLISTKTRKPVAKCKHHIRGGCVFAVESKGTTYCMHNPMAVVAAEKLAGCPREKTVKAPKTYNNAKQ